VAPTERTIWLEHLSLNTLVLHISSKETSDQTGLVQWQKRLGVEEANNQRQTAATRGNMAHSSAEYLLKTASALARRAVNKRTIKFDDRGLARIPPPITKWALEKVHKSLPPVGWSAAGYARGLTQWIVENVTQVHASEFSAFTTRLDLLEHVTAWWTSRASCT
jgi:hypothetical protein